MKRKYYFLIIMLLSVVYFTGTQPPEIADRIMVHAIGIDIEEEGYRVTMQTFTPESSGSETSIDPSQPNVSIVSDSGRTVGEAIRICFNRLGGNIFIGQNQILLFGRGVDLSQKEDLFGYFLSSSETFLNVDCASAENTAEEILRTPITGNAITSDKYPEMIRSASDNGRCVEVSFTELLDRINSHEKTLVLPTFSLSQQTSSDSEGGESSGCEEKSDKLEERRLKISSGAVYANGKFRAEISAEQMGIYGMICGSGENVHAEISGGGRKYSETYRISSRAVIYLTPQGKVFDQQMAKEYAKEEDLIFLCGHYEGIDERVLERIVTDYVSIGDYVLTGGELPALVMMDTISRLVPGVLNNDMSAETESFSEGLLEYPQYTRPAIWRDEAVPEVLLSGHHKKLQEWYRRESVIRTAKRRPDMLMQAQLSEEEKELAEQYAELE